MNEPIPVAVVGTGRMGRHHVRIYSEMPETRLVGVVDKDFEKARKIAAEFNTQAFESVGPLVGKIKAASIAVPTVAHAEVAAPLIENGVAILVEKPLAPDSASGRALLEMSNKHNTLLQVGHTERFNPAVRAMNRLNVLPRFVEVHRISPFTFRSADISVVMDMMIHDIDIILHIVKARPIRVEAAGVSVLAPSEDIVNARVTFDGGCVVNLTASRLALKTERKIRVFSEESYVSLDYQKKNGVAIKKDANLDLLKLAREKNVEDLSQLAGTDFGSMVKVEPLQIDDAEPLRAELESFLHSMKTGDEPEVSAADGVAALELAEQIMAACKSHRWEGLEPEIK
jgi:predicted dehydrogenase